MRGIKDRLVKQLSKKHGVDPRVTRLIVDSPIKFYKRRSADDNDIRPVRIRYFGVFMPKPKYIREYEAKQAEDSNIQSLTT